MKGVLVAALIARQGRLLLVHNSKHGALRYEPPGGKVHPGEMPEDAVVREAMEETGVVVRPGRLICSYPTSSPEGEFTVMMYACTLVSGEPTVMEPEKISGLGWYSIVELERLKEKGRLVPNVVSALDAIEEALL